ncbi:MAG: polymer-forming cytoskeletal protein [Bacteroidota bacterium]
MFGNNKNETTKPKTTSFTSSPTNSLNSLVKGTTIEGTVRSESDIRIDGRIKGQLFCDAKVIIGPSGTIEGEITCQNAVIEGNFQGTITVKDLLIVKESAKVSGDVRTVKLVVTDGAIFNVNCNMTGKAAAPKNAKAEPKVINPNINKTSEKARQVG